MLGYTKGDWRVEDWGYNKVITATGTDNEICMISRYSQSRGNEEYMANAHLIAAAPAMYEALESARDILREIHHYQDDQPVLSPINKALAQARRE